MSIKKIGIGAALAASAVAIAIGGSALASADTPSTSGSSASGTAPSGAGYGTPGAPDARGGSSDTPVTGAELTKVTAAMTAKDAAVSVTAVRKDPDGSYDVLGNKAGAPVLYDVSADLTIFTAHTGGPGWKGGPRGGFSGTAVTGAELTKVTAAMKAKDAAVSVTAVRKDPDGSYDVLGSKAGAPVMYDVSADLTTFTAHTGGPGGPGGPGGAGGGRGHGGPEGAPSGPATGSSTANPSA